MVQYPHEIKIVSASISACKPYHAQKQCYRTSMTCQAALPRHKDFPEACPTSKIVIRLIKQAMSESRPHYRTYQKSIQKRIQHTVWHTFSLEEPFENIPSEDKAGNEQYGIPPDRESSDMENLRIHVPVYHQEVKHKHINYLRIAAIPGSSFPSRYSSIAPPPVDT